MGGVCLIAHLDGSPVPVAHLDAMVAAAPYRGADGLGRWVGASRTETGGAGGRAEAVADMAVAYQALHVTPESALERQPLVDERRGLVLAAVVRLDDRAALHDELRDQLVPVAGGAVDPRARPTDGDLVLAAYSRWGEECGARLVGDFAFVLLDRRAGLVLCQRDPMGMRPLYWRLEPRRLIVATEVSQVLAVPGVTRDLFEPAIAAHLRGEFDTPGWTAYAGIHELPPGHGLAVPMRSPGSSPVPRRFWDIDPSRRVRERTEDDYAARFRELLEAAVESRLRTSRSVGILLSGGMDSGTVASVAGLLHRRGTAVTPEVRTYSWAFEELAEADERAVSDQIVGHYGLTPSPVHADELWPLRDFPRHAPDVDGPFAGVYQVLLDHAARQAAEEGVRVMLVGARGDLMVGDLARDLPGALMAGQWRAVRDDIRLYRRWKRVGLAKAIWYLLFKPPLETVLSRSQAPLARAVWRRVHPSTSDGGSDLHTPWVHEDLLERTREQRAAVRGLQAPDGMMGVARRARYELIFLPLQMRNMAWSERLSARAGLSLADPWSDRRIAEFILAVPQWVVQRLSHPKRLAHLAMRGVMPEAARAQVGKTSPAPLYRRALETRARDLIETLLRDSDSAARGYVHEDVLLDHYREIAEGAPDTPGFWWALTLEMWLRTHQPSEPSRRVSALDNSDVTVS